jgi:hypothetical protein
MGSMKWDSGDTSDRAHYPEATPSVPTIHRYLWLDARGPPETWPTAAFCLLELNGPAILSHGDGPDSIHRDAPGRSARAVVIPS